MTLTVVGIHDFYGNNLLMWLQEAHKIAQYQKIFLGDLIAPHHPRSPHPIGLASLAWLSLPPPQEKSEMTPLIVSQPTTDTSWSKNRLGDIRGVTPSVSFDRQLLTDKRKLS